MSHSELLHVGYWVVAIMAIVIALVWGVLVILAYSETPKNDESSELSQPFKSVHARLWVLRQQSSTQNKRKTDEKE